MAHRTITLTKLREPDSSSGQVGMPQSRGQGVGKTRMVTKSAREPRGQNQSNNKNPYSEMGWEVVPRGTPRAHVQLTHQQPKQESAHQAPRDKVLCKMPTPPGLNAAPFFVKASLSFAFCFLCCFFWVWGVASLCCRHSGLVLPPVGKMLPTGIEPVTYGS